MSAVVVLGCSSSAHFFDLPDNFSAFRRANLLASDQESLRAGRAVLELDGNAADVSVAMGFASLISLPARTSLLARGVCLIYDPVARRSLSIDFARPGASLLHALIVLNAGYGKLNWSALLAPAQRQAMQGGGMFSVALNGGGSAQRPEHLVDAEGMMRPRPVLSKALEVLMQNPLRFAEVAPFANHVRAEMWRADGMWRASRLTEVGDSLLAVPDHSTQADFVHNQAGSFGGAVSGVLFGAVDSDGLAVLCGVGMRAPYGQGWDRQLDMALPGVEMGVLPKLVLGYNPHNHTLKWLAGFAASTADEQIIKVWDSLLENNVTGLERHQGFAMSYCPIGLPNRNNDNTTQCMTKSGALTVLAGTVRE